MKNGEKSGLRGGVNNSTNLKWEIEAKNNKLELFKTEFNWNCRNGLV